MTGEAECHPARLAAELDKALEELKARHALVVDVRGKGLIAALELKKADGWLERFRSDGVLNRIGGEAVPAA